MSSRSSGGPFDPSVIKAGDTVRGIDPCSLAAGRPNLIQSRLDVQRQLLIQGIERFTPIVVTTQGIIYDGNHAARAAAEVGHAIAAQVVNERAKGFGDIMSLPVSQ